MKRKLISVLLSICMVLLLPVGAMAAANFSDMPAENDWSYKALTAAIDNGLLQGSDGRLMPGDTLTRAQLAAFLNRAFGAVSTADISGYSDVKSTEWYGADIAKAVRMGTLVGASGLMRPESAVTREQAFTALARALKLPDGKLSSLDAFGDKAAVSPWAAPSLAAMAQAGYIHGTDGRLDPGGIMTRAQFAQVMYNVFSRYISAAGTYSESIDGNVLVSAGGVTLKGLTISGDLILGEGVGNGDVTLDGVTVLGRVVVRGGGANSIRIINKSDVGSIIVGKTGDGGVRIRTEEGCSVEVIYIDDGLDNIILEGTFNQVSVQTDAPVVLRDATVTGLTVSGAGADVKLDGTTNVSATQITGDATGAKLEVGDGAKVTKLESAADGVTVSGGGTVTQAIVSGNNTAVDTEGTEVTIEDGTTGVTQDGEPVEPETPSNPPGGGTPPSSAEVTSLAELQATFSNSNVSSVIIKQGITIPSGITVTFTKPVTIADLPTVMLTINGTLVNNSTFTSRGLGSDFGDTGIVLEEGSFTNNGTFINESRFGTFKGTFTNGTGGSVQNKNWFHCIGTTLTNNGAFSSMGDITLINSSAYNEGDHAATFTNAAGATFVSEGPGSVLVGTTCSFINTGTATSGYLDNFGTLTNNGSFTYTDNLVNAGLIDGDIELTAGNDAKFGNYLPVTDFGPLETALDSLDEEDYVGIAVTAVITLEDDLTVDKHVLIAPDCGLTVPAEYTLTVTSVDGYNELLVRGSLFLNGGALMTTQVGEGEDADIGQVTLLDGALEVDEDGDYSITNDGVILVIFGSVPEGLVVGGDHEIVYMQNIAGVSSEAELLSAMADDEVDEVEIIDSFTLNANLNITKRTTVTYDDEAHVQRTLTIGSGAALTVRDGAFLSIQGAIINNGMVVNDASSGGVFMGSTSSFTNNGILNNNHNFDILEGTLTNNDTLTVGSGGDNVILMRGGIITNNAGAEFINQGAMDMDTSSGLEGAVLSRAPAFTNAGTFNNGAFGSSQVYCGMRNGTFTNTGTFVNNGNVDLTYVAFTHMGESAYYATYNSAGTHITGGSFSTEGEIDGEPVVAPDGSFNNEGYMRIVDQYDKDGEDHICTITIADNTLDNDSRWLDCVAEVYSETGLTEAETAQQTKVTALGAGESFFGTSVYSRLDIMTNITLTANKSLSAFPSYWVESMWSWNGTADVQTPATLTINNGVTLTVGQERTLHAERGDIVNNGTIVTAASTGEGETHIGGGALEVWPYASFTNGGAVTNNGTFIIRNEFNGTGGIAFAAEVTGNAVTNTEYLAMTHSDADIRAAAAEDAPVYGRIDIKSDSNIELSHANLTIDANVFIEPGSGLIVPYGVTLTLAGEHWMHNAGDMSVYGDLIIGDEVSAFSFFNTNSLEIGVLSGTEDASVTVSAGSLLVNDGTLDVYATGTLDASQGSYVGTEPSVTEGGTYMPPAP